MGNVNLSSPWVTIPVALASLLIAYGVIWRKGLVPLGRFFRNVSRIAEATPTLVLIAEEFHPNGGNSLRDTVDRIEAKVDATVELSADTRSTVERRLDEHLALRSWDSERDEVLGQLRAMETRQAFIIERVGAVLLDTGTDHDSLVIAIREALQPGGEPDAPHGP